jgi:uncharacterized protein YkwD
LLFLLVGAAGALAAESAERSPGQAAPEHSIRACANRHRRAAGLEALLPSRALSKAARLHARNMARQHFFDHVDPQGRGPEDRVAIFDREQRYTPVGENIAAGYPSAAAACEGWMHSAGHRANILGREYTALGTGFSRGGDYGRYYVQVFAGETSRSARASRSLPTSQQQAIGLVFLSKEWVTGPHGRHKVDTQAR